MADQARGAIIGAIGGGGAASGGILGGLYQGDILLGVLLAVASGCMLSGAAFLYVSHKME